MPEIKNIFISCPNWEDLIAAINSLSPIIHPETRKIFHKIFLEYYHNYGLEGAWERLNNRSVATVLSEYTPSSEEKPIASGEKEGLRYELFESPRPPKSNQQ
jgi:hypothetical protein